MDGGFRWWALWVSRSLLRLSPALIIIAFFGWSILAERDPHSPWLRIVRWSSLPLILLLISSHKDVGHVRLSKETARSAGLTVLFAICAVLVWYFKAEPWTPIATGLLMAVYLNGMSKLQNRSRRIMVAGWIIAGVLASLVNWPNEQRFDLVIWLGGWACALQIAADLAKDLRTARPQPENG